VQHHLSRSLRIFANAKRFADQVRALVDRAPTPVRWFVVDASAITDIDYSAAQSIRDFIDELKRRGVQIVFARVTPYLRSDMDRHHITDAVSEKWIFATLHEAMAAVRGSVVTSTSTVSTDNRKG
jgi:sulfate permease, SulP family